MSWVLAPCSSTRQLVRYSRQASGHSCVGRSCGIHVPCRPVSHQRYSVVRWVTPKRVSALEEWRDLIPVAVVFRRVLVNVFALFVLVLGEAVPLCNAETRTLPSSAVQFLSATSISSHGALQMLHPFLLGLMPFVEGMIFVQIIGHIIEWRRLPVPPRFALSRAQTRTSYGQATLTFLSGILGAGFATVFAVIGTRLLINCGAVGHTQFWDITAALVAGSAITQKLSELITQFGIGQGVSFIYTLSIAARMQSIWVGAAQTIPAGVLAQCLLVAGLMIVGCILVNNLKAYVPLVSYRFDGQMDSSSQEPPKLPIILAPNATLVRACLLLTLVFIAAHFMLSFFANYQALITAILSISIVAANIVDTPSTASMLASSLRSMQLGLDGASPGEDTEHVLAAQLLIFRLTGAMSLLLLFFVSRWADAYLKSIAGIPLSVNELLIVAGTVIQCRNTMSRSLKEVHAARVMKNRLASVAM